MLYLDFNIIFSYYSIIYIFIFILSLIIIVAYFTLLERKLMAIIHKRRGPDYIGFFGLLQPLMDAVKLIFKETSLPKLSFAFIFLLSPFLVFFISMISWLFIPLSWYGSLSTSEFNFLWIILLSSFNTYSIFLSGWSSNCKYALLGSVRSIVQMISFEISISLLLLPIFFLNGSFNLLSIVSYQSFVNFFNFSWSLPNFLLIFVCILIETNRAPFDLPEAEAELVAGYNVEYSSIPFAFFFLGEYLNIFIMCVILNNIFFKGWFTNFFFFESFFYFLNIFLIMIIIIWVRATLPRARYDLLLTFCWKYSLLYSSCFLSFFIIFYHFLIFFKLFI